MVLSLNLQNVTKTHSHCISLHESKSGFAKARKDTRSWRWFLPERMVVLLHESIVFAFVFLGLHQTDALIVGQVRLTRAIIWLLPACMTARAFVAWWRLLKIWILKLLSCQLNSLLFKSCLFLPISFDYTWIHYSAYCLFQTEYEPNIQ